MHRLIVIGLLTLLAQPALAAALKPEAINTADFSGKIPVEDKLSPLAVKVQVLLDRAHFSPGEIDGRFGDNVEKALLAFAEANSLPAGKALTPEIWSKLLGQAGEPIIASYTLTEQDLKEPFVDKLPTKMEDMKSLPHLGYASIKEMLAERFHLSQELLAELNPEQKFDHAGDSINVAGVTPTPELSKAADEPKKASKKESSKKDSSKKDAKPDNEPQMAARVEVDKQRQTVKAFAKDCSLLAFYPASVGSEEKPTPTGTLKVVEVEANPNYRYNPKYKFSGVKSTTPFTIAPGPNNPVGAMWIGLAGNDGYGIHGTGDPSRVSKSDSHGCVRLTNWDVLRLSHLVKKGVEVVFVEGKQAAK